MNFIKEYKSIICILLVAIILFTWSTVVTSATIDSFVDLDDEATEEDEEENTAENIRVENTNTNTNTNTNNNDNTNISNNTNTNISVGVSNKDVKSTTSTSNANASYPNKDYSTTSENQIANTGIEDYPSAILLIGLAVVAIFGFIKFKKYSAM